MSNQSHITFKRVVSHKWCIFWSKFVWNTDTYWMPYMAWYFTLDDCGTLKCENAAISLYMWKVARYSRYPEGPTPLLWRASVVLRSSLVELLFIIFTIFGLAQLTTKLLRRPASKCTVPHIYDSRDDEDSLHMWLINIPNSIRLILNQHPPTWVQNLKPILSSGLV